MNYLFLLNIYLLLHWCIQNVWLSLYVKVCFPTVVVPFFTLFTIVLYLKEKHFSKSKPFYYLFWIVQGYNFSKYLCNFTLKKLLLTKWICSDSFKTFTVVVYSIMNRGEELKRAWMFWTIEHAIRIKDGEITLLLTRFYCERLFDLNVFTSTFVSHSVWAN